MLVAAGESDPSGSGIAAVLVVAVVFWLLSRHDRRTAAVVGRAKRKAEIAAIVRSRPGDADLFQEVLDELKAKDTKGKTT